MKNKLVKRILIFVVITAIAAGSVCGGLYIRKVRLRAEVMSVESLNTGYVGNEVSSSGTVSNDRFQEVKLPQDARIREIFVEEGQEVHAGDRLLELDVSAARLEYQIKALEVEKLQNKIEIAKNDLKILKNTKPVLPAPPEEVHSLQTETQDRPENMPDQEMSEEKAAEQMPGEETPGYTKEELKQMIAEKEQEISGLDLSKRKAELEVEKLKQKQTDGVIYASVDGTVKNLREKDQIPTDTTPFLTVSGTGGLYVTGSVSEFLLGEVKPGQIVTVSSWESGITCAAVVRSVGTCPTQNAGYGNGNQNVSYYPYTAYIEDESGVDLKNGESVELSMILDSEEDAGAVYLFRGYIRQENGRSYVLKADENNRLARQYVQTGKMINGDTIEVKSGLLAEDRIAFPYGKAAREGARAVDSEESGV